jgi:hypothetical protein
MEHLIGATVGIPTDTRQALGVSWETAIIVGAVATNTGLAVHLLGAEGIITPAVQLEALTLPDPKTTQAWLREWTEKH